MNKNKVPFSVTLALILLLSNNLYALAAPITGNGTSTFVCVYSGATTISGFPSFTFDDVAKLFTVNATTSLQGLTFTNATGTSLKVSTPIGVPSGGTGASTYNYGVLVANSTSSFATVVPGTSGNVLTSDGSSWVSQSLGCAPTGAVVTYTAPTAPAG